MTRPEPGAAETAARVEARGLRTVLAPALVLTPLPHAALPPAQALLLPSRAAARAVAAGPSAPDAAEDRAKVFALAEEVRDRIQAKVFENLVEREGAFL